MTIEKAIEIGKKNGISKEEIIRRLAEVGLQCGDCNIIKVALGNKVPMAQPYTNPGKRPGIAA